VSVIMSPEVFPMGRMLGARLFAVVALTMLAQSAPGGRAIAAGQQGPWPMWRGADGSGVSAETGLPAEWTPEKNIRWKTPLPGRGHSSPVVWDRRIVVTTDVEGPVVPGKSAIKHIVEGQEFKHPDSVGGDRSHSLRVLCIDRDSGKILWERVAYDGPVLDDRHRKGSYAAPTPATDGTRIYAWFGNEGVFCFDFSGRLLWKAAPGPIATVGMGPGTSPVVLENRLFLQCDEDNGDASFVVALDTKTGRQLWKTPRKVEASWATPIVVRTGDSVELVCSGNQWIIAYDVKTGAERWRIKGLDSNAIPSPVAGHGLVFVSAGFPVKKTYAVRLGATGDLTGGPNVVWSYDRGTAYVPSTVLYGDFLYLMSDRGILSCLDAKTGTVRYDNGRIPIPATFTASPVAYEGRLLLTSEDGDTYVVRAGPTHELIATNSVGEPVYATPALSGGMVFIRGESHLFGICTGPKRP
jgi:outer membrane protein assembly factor BamB